MGNKCKFCVTFHGNVKRVAGVLQGNGCGCGRCNGQFSGKHEIELAVKYYESQMASLAEHKKAIDGMIAEYYERIDQLRSIDPVNE